MQPTLNPYLQIPRAQVPMIPNAPVIPKAPRSLRRRILRTEPLQGGEINVFEDLEAIAGKLLLKKESFISEHRDQGSDIESQSVGQPTNLTLI
ncbi:hypothetical protein L1887_02726 [Cichorium endivia]|nr:hypothetical protein L1887_02726 [Cichorium endivia]